MTVGIKCVGPVPVIGKDLSMLETKVLCALHFLAIGFSDGV